MLFLEGGGHQVRLLYFAFEFLVCDKSEVASKYGHVNVMDEMRILSLLLCKCDGGHSTRDNVISCVRE